MEKLYFFVEPPLQNDIGISAYLLFLLLLGLTAGRALEQSLKKNNATGH